ncbi:STP1 protein [Plasmodium ovale wallikeri]|uniref:STP1 protein n=1 Tax=Plasmodium ovale wallikeri TaxID=864142 RepID=A0A1A9ACG9_PLAOA|nr:STP1 protein [Plasmodium ovale wallikeri]
MSHNSGFTTLTHYITIDAFLRMTKSDIQKLIREYGHKNCGLRHEELCKELKTFINQRKTPLLRVMNEDGKKEWNSEWSKKRNEFFNRLFEEEGFANMCYPPVKIGNPSLYQLKSKHIQFCKKRDPWKATVEKKNEFDECVKYNQWIMSETKKLTLEFLQNVQNSNFPTVKKYFSTKEHPGGHDPRDTYRKSKLDCTKYNPLPGSHPQIPVAKPPTISLPSPAPPTVGQKSQKKTGSSATDKDRGSPKTKPEENIPPKSKPHIPDSQTSSPSKIQTGDTSTVQDTHVKTEAPGSPVNRSDKKKESILAQGQPPINSPPSAQAEAPPQTRSPPLPPKVTSPTPATHSVPEATATTGRNTTLIQTPFTSPSLTITSNSSLNSGSPLPSNPLPPATDNKGQDRTIQPSTTSETLTTTHPNQSVPSTTSADSSLPQPQLPAMNTLPNVTSAQGPGTPATASASTVTITTAAPVTATITTTYTIQNPISSSNEAPGTNESQKPPPPQDASEPKATAPNTELKQTVIQAPAPLSVSDNGGISISSQPVRIDDNKQTTLSSASSPKTKESIEKPGVHLSNSVTPHSEYTPIGSIEIQDVKHQKTVSQADPKKNNTPLQMRTNIDQDYLAPSVNANTNNIPGVRPGRDLNSNPFTKKGKNYKPNIIPESIPPLMHIIPTIFVILATITLIYQLYKYTPFGFLLGRRRKKKKRDLRRIFEIPEKPTYESPNITVHELEDSNLVGKTMENDVYTKLLKINRYKQEIQKRKKKSKKTLIEVHMEVLEEYKTDDWELHKGDFLKICLRGFINDKNDFYSNFPNSKLTINNINEKTIENIQEQEILWNNWIEKHRNILEQWKKEEWFHILKNKWRNEEKIYKEKNDKLQEIILNEQATHSIVSQKDIWKQWISKQAILVDMFNKEDWFKSIIYAQDKEKDNYHINEYNNITVTNENQLKNEKVNHEQGRSKDIIQKLMVQIHMMVLEECIKEEMIKHKELCLDDFIEDIHNQNNYDEKRNISQ